MARRTFGSRVSDFSATTSESRVREKEKLSGTSEKLTNDTKAWESKAPI